MNSQSITSFFNSIGASFNGVVREILISIGLHPDKVGSVINLLGLFVAGFITVLIVTIGIISYIRGTQYEPFYTSYEDDFFIRGKAGTIMGIITIICAVWFLFAIVFISINNAF